MAASHVIYMAHGMRDEPLIILDNGVAAIDVITISLAAQKSADAGFDVAVPKSCDVDIPETFRYLSRVTADASPDGLRVLATVDTKKMVWDLPGGDAEAGEFVDYAGQPRYSVKLYDLPISLVDGLMVSRAAMRLVNGAGAYLWFVEMPLKELDSLDLYGLYGRICQITQSYGAADESQLFDTVTIPALQLRYERELHEIQAMNPGVIESAKQRVLMALDESGARVRAEAEWVCAGIPSFPPDPKEFHFGERHPVVFWLTERHRQIGRNEPSSDSPTPFAVIVTTSESWLDPDFDMSFGDYFSEC
jgi:hypothetical protein